MPCWAWVKSRGTAATAITIYRVMPSIAVLGDRCVLIHAVHLHTFGLAATSAPNASLLVSKVETLFPSEIKEHILLKP